MGPIADLAISRMMTRDVAQFFGSDYFVGVNDEASILQSDSVETNQAKAQTQTPLAPPTQPPPHDPSTCPLVVELCAAQAKVAELERKLECLRAPPQWVPDSDASTCFGCTSRFTLLRRRHHCRMCGGVFCDECSQKRARLPLHWNLEDLARVCEGCFAELKAQDALMRRRGPFLPGLIGLGAYAMDTPSALTSSSNQATPATSRSALRGSQVQAQGSAMRVVRIDAVPLKLSGVEGQGGSRATPTRTPRASLGGNQGQGRPRSRIPTPPPLPPDAFLARRPLLNLAQDENAVPLGVGKSKKVGGGGKGLRDATNASFNAKSAPRLPLDELKEGRAKLRSVKTPLKENVASLPARDDILAELKQNLQRRRLAINPSSPPPRQVGGMSTPQQQQQQQRSGLGPAASAGKIMGWTPVGSVAEAINNPKPFETSMNSSWINA